MGPQSVVYSWLSNATAASVGAPLRRLRSRLWRRGRRTLHWLSAQVVRATALAAGGVMVWILWDEWDKPLTLFQRFYLLLGLLAAAALAQHGDGLLNRLKRVGPVELFAREVQSILPDIQRILEDIEHIPPAPTGRLAPDLEHVYRRADAMARYLEFSNIRDSDYAGTRDLHSLLAQVGRIALLKRDYARAIDRLQLLRDVSGGSYKPRETWVRLSLASTWLALSLAAGDPRRRSKLISAADLTEEALEEFEDHQLHFNLAYARDELGMHPKAIESSRKALELRPAHAPTRYNLAVSLVKMRQFTEAFAELSKLRQDDDEISRTIEVARTDPELKLMRSDPKWAWKLRCWLASRSGW